MNYLRIRPGSSLKTIRYFSKMRENTPYQPLYQYPSQWQRHRVDWGGHVHLSFPRSRFFDFSKSVTKPLEEGGVGLIRSISIFALAKKPPLRKMLLEKVVCRKISKWIKNAKKGFSNMSMKVVAKKMCFCPPQFFQAGDATDPSINCP